MAAAAQRGEPVVVADKMSETEKVVANPDGTLTSTRNLRPVRVSVDGEWTPVDLTLVRREDGVIVPRVAAVDLRLSGGGAQAPLVVVGEGDYEVGLGWQGTLPAPTLDGPTATYAEVLPGVDLTVTADVEGFTQLLVVKNREAAQNPALDMISYANHRQATTVGGGEDGLEVRSADGRTVFVGDASRMWDSADRQARMGVQVSDAAIAITPDRRFFDDPDTEYPVFVDPSYYATGRKNHHAVVQGAYPDAHNYDRTDGQLSDLKAGFACDGPCFTSRTYVEMATGGMPGKFVHSATLAMRVIHSNECAGAGPTEVWRTDGISSATTWASQPVWREYQSEANPTNNLEYCPSPTGGGVEFPVTNAIKAAAANGWLNVTFGLRGKVEGSAAYWRRFDLNPELRVWYNSYPRTPDQLATVSGTKSYPCVTGPSRPYIGDLTPTMSARFTDQDPGMLNARFYYGPVGQASSGYVNVTQVPPGTKRNVDVPAGAFVNGGVYFWRVQAGDDQLLSPMSPDCEVGIDTTPPVAPAVTSAEYPQNSEHAFAGDSVRFTVRANGSSDVVRYVYTSDLTDPDPNGSPSVQAPTPGADATITITMREGENKLRVRSVDRADNSSSTYTEYVLRASGARPPTVQLPLDRDTGGLTYAGTASPQWTTGYVGDAFNAKPAAKDHLVSSAPMVDTSENYSVAAWVRLDTSVGHAVVLGQDGNGTTAFSLQYQDTIDRWAFRAANADAATTTVVDAVSDRPPVWHTWTHLIGTYDANERKLHLYVNGVLEGEADYTATWASSGPFVVGAGKFGGSRGSYFTGPIDDVRVWDRVVTVEEAARIANTAVPRAHYKLDENAGTTTRDEVSGQNATLRGDVSWGADEFTSVRLTGSAGGDVRGPAPALVPGQSFTVSAWVRADQTNTDVRTAVGISDATYSPFLLDYNGSQRRWEFFVVNAAHTASWSVFSTQSATENSWAYLTGVYDATAKTITLYVDGINAGSTSGVAPWGGGGALVIGGGKWNGLDTAPLRGLVDDVRLYSGVRALADISDDMSARTEEN